MQFGNRDAPFRAVGLDRLHFSLEHEHRDCHVARMARDASVADTHHGMRTAKPTDSRAAAAGLALVTRLVGVIEVRTARALKQVARGRRLVS